MSKTTTITKACLLVTLGALLPFGCGGGRSGSVIEGDRIIGPAERVSEYLALIYKTHTRDEAYDLLTAETKNIISLKDFRGLLRSELSDVFAVRSSSEVRISIDHLKDFNITKDHCIIYSLVQVSFPYDIGLSDKFRLTKFHVHREGDAWHIEPFIHKRTFTRRFVPSLVVGTQWELEEKRKDFYDIIGKDLLDERKKFEADAESAKAQEDKRKPKSAETVGSLVVPDLSTDEPGSDGDDVDNAPPVQPDDVDAKRKVKALLTVGKLHFQTGNILAAEASFRKVLEIDRSNETATDLLKKCDSIRRLQDEKREQIELIQKLLEIEEKDDDEDTAESSDK